MECVQMESVKSVGHEKCWGVKGHIWHGCPQADGAFAWESVCAGLELSLVNGYVRNVCF